MLCHLLTCQALALDRAKVKNLVASPLEVVYDRTMPSRTQARPAHRLLDLQEVDGVLRGECTQCGVVDAHRNTRPGAGKRQSLYLCPNGWSARSRHQTNLEAQCYGRGITPADFQLLLSTQGNRCAVCHKSYDAAKQGWAIDHSHSTGRIRGVLCTQCNTGLGHFRDSIPALESAIEYLRYTRY